MLPKVSTFALIFLVFAFPLSDLFAASSSKLICVNASGKIFLRSKCKAAETLLSSNLAQIIPTAKEAAGDTGPQGEPGAPGINGIVGENGPQGAQGPQGIPGTKGSIGQINFSACHLTSEGYDTNFSNPSNPILYAEVFCNPNTEFLLEDESRVSFLPNATGSKAAIQSRSPYFNQIGNDNREYGVGIFVNRFLTVGDGTFELIVRGICCPR